MLRNITGDYLRNLRRRAKPQATSDEEVKVADGTALDLPGEDETVPETPAWPAPLRPHLCSDGAASQVLALRPFQRAAVRTRAGHS